MANTKVLSVNNSNNRFTLKLTLTEGDYSIANNSSPVTYKLELIANTSAHFTDYMMGSSITLGGVNVHYQARTKYYSIADYGTLLLASGSKTFTHNGDGSLDLSVSYSIDMASASYTPGALSGTGSFSLTKIPRYANFTKHRVVSSDENSITVEWDADSECDAVWYSLGDQYNSDGNWIPASWPKYTITGLPEAYNTVIRTRIKRKDSQLTTDSIGLSASTYYYPHCTSAPNFTIGDNLTLDFYNPLGRNITVTGYALTDGSEIFLGSTTGTRLIGFNDSKHVNNQYESIPNSPEGSYKVVVTYGSVKKERAGGKYSIKWSDDERPTLSDDFSYVDGDPNISKLAGDSSYIVQNKSKVKVKFGAATTNKGAGEIKEYRFTFNGVTKTVKSPSDEVMFDSINTPYNQKLIMTAVDSRGVVSKEKSKDVRMIPYDTPKLYAHTDYGYIQCQRCNEKGDLDRNGKYLFIAVQGRWSALPSVKNTSHLEVKCTSTDGTYGPYGLDYQNDPTVDANNGYISKGDFRGKVEGITLDGTKSYTVTIRCVDLLSSDTDNKGLSYAIPTADVNMHLRKGGHGVAIGKYSETEDVFEVDYNAQFNKAINGTFIKSAYITTNTVTIQTKFSNFKDESGYVRQSIFMFGTANGAWTYGLIAIHSHGVVGYVGNRTDIGCTADTETGKITINFPNDHPLWDYLTFISAHNFTIE